MIDRRWVRTPNTHTQKSNLTMQLDFVDDDIRDHTSLDSKVYAVFRLDRNEEPPIAIIAGSVLSAIVCGCPDKLDQKLVNPETARDIVEQYSLNPDGDENSNLKKLLGWCWRQGTFEKIRRLSGYSSMILIFLSYVLRSQKYCGQCLHTKVKRSGRKENGMHHLLCLPQNLCFASLVFI